VLYPLDEILLLMLCATIAGADDFVEIGTVRNRTMRVGEAVVLPHVETTAEKTAAQPAPPGRETF
jgi:hypothetical protein